LLILSVPVAASVRAKCCFYPCRMLLLSVQNAASIRVKCCFYPCRMLPCKMLPLSVQNLLLLFLCFFLVSSGEGTGFTNENGTISAIQDQLRISQISPCQLLLLWAPVAASSVQNAASLRAKCWFYASSCWVLSVQNAASLRAMLLLSVQNAVSIRAKFYFYPC
jgi:hypothetical protein